MKNNKYLLLGFSLFSLLFVSCNDDEDTLEGVRNTKPVVTLSSSSYTATEGEEITLTLTVDTPFSEDADFKLELVDGSGSFRDFTSSGVESTIDEGGFGQGAIGYKLVFPAFTQTATFTITPVKDLYAEGTETLKIWLRSSGNGLGLVNSNSEYINITVNDFVSDYIGLKLDWRQEYTDSFGSLHNGEYLGADGNPHEYGDYDFDLYVFNADTFDEVTGYATATGAVPEETDLSATLADGNYLLVVDKYANGSAPAEDNELLVTLEVAKYGVWYHKLEVPGYKYTTATSAPSGLNGGEVIAAVLTKAGTTYTLQNLDMEVLAQGRYASIFNTVKGRRK